MKKIVMMFLTALVVVLAFALSGCNETQVKDVHAKVQDACAVAQPTLATLTAMAVLPDEQLKFTELAGAVKMVCDAPVLDVPNLKHLAVTAIPEALHLVATSASIPDADRERIQMGLIVLQVAVSTAIQQAGGGGT